MKLSSSKWLPKITRTLKSWLTKMNRSRSLPKTNKNLPRNKERLPRNNERLPRNNERLPKIYRKLWKSRKRRSPNLNKHRIKRPSMANFRQSECRQTWTSLIDRMKTGWKSQVPSYYKILTRLTKSLSRQVSVVLNVALEVVRCLN